MLFLYTKLPLFHTKYATAIPIARIDKTANAAITISTSWYLPRVLPKCSKYFQELIY